MISTMNEHNDKTPKENTKTPQQNHGIEVSQHLTMDLTALTLATHQEPAPAMPSDRGSLAYLFRKPVISPDTEEWVKCDPRNWPFFTTENPQSDVLDIYMPYDADRNEQSDVPDVYMSNNEDRNKDGVDTFRPSES
jgi:hypothetical protein